MRLFIFLAFLMAMQTQAFSATQADLDSDRKATQKLDKITMQRDISQIKQDITSLRRDVDELKRAVKK